MHQKELIHPDALPEKGSKRPRERFIPSISKSKTDPLLAERPVSLLSGTPGTSQGVQSGKRCFRITQHVRELLPTTPTSQDVQLNPLSPLSSGYQWPRCGQPASRSTTSSTRLTPVPPALSPCWPPSSRPSPPWQCPATRSSLWEMAHLCCWVRTQPEKEEKGPNSEGWR